MNDTKETKVSEMMSDCLSHAKKRVMAVVVLLLLAALTACMPAAREGGAPPSEIPKEALTAGEGMTPAPEPKVPEAQPDSTIPSEARPKRQPQPLPPSVERPESSPPSAEARVGQVVPVIPSAESPIVPSPPQTTEAAEALKSYPRAPGTELAIGSDSVFAKGPDLPGGSKRFHQLHPINKEEGCVSTKCHPLRTTVKYVHAPVGTRACIVCHVDITTRPPLGLVKTGTELCFSCHKQQKAFYYQARFVHKPVREKCTNCHDSHGSETNKYYLEGGQIKICNECHQNKKENPDKVPQIKIDRIPHKPIVEGKCAGCHAPHASNFKKLLKEGPREIGLCLSCHKKKAEEIKQVSFKHGPIREGLCNPCHKSHGADSEKLLRYFYVKRFYNSFDPRLYDLCFKCHKQTLVMDERTTTLTKFRNGDRNLHYLHVNRDKGRTCIACHEVHGGYQESQIRESSPFGEWQIPIKFVKTSTGGKCLATCHVPKDYDRENPVKLDIDATEQKTVMLMETK